MSDSDEWASASDSELQDDESQPARTTELAENLTLPDDKTSVNKSSSINTTDNNIQGSVELSEEDIKLKDTDTLPSRELPAPPPYEYVCISTSEFMIYELFL